MREEKYLRRPERERPEKHRDEIGFHINGLHHMIHRLMYQYVARGGDQPAHAWIIGYLYANREKDLYQRDLQNQFSVRRSTMTGILQQMEKNGMITREPVEWDARLKKIRLTEKAVAFQEEFCRGIEQVEAKLSQNLTPWEKAQFIALCEKIRQGLEEQEDSKRGES